jgi:hypothetical protein
MAIDFEDRFRIHWSRRKDTPMPAVPHEPPSLEQRIEELQRKVEEAKLDFSRVETQLMTLREDLKAILEQLEDAWKRCF